MSVFDSACGGYRVFIGALGADTGKREMIRELKKYGTILDIWLARNPPGYGYVVFRSASEAETLVRQMNGRKLAGRRVKVEHARPLRKKACRSILPFHAIASRLKVAKTSPMSRARKVSNPSEQSHHRSEVLRRWRSPCRCHCNRPQSYVSTSRSGSRSRTESRPRKHHVQKRRPSDRKNHHHKQERGKHRRARRRSRSSSSSLRSRSSFVSCPQNKRSKCRIVRSRSGESDTSSCERYFKSRGRRRHTSSPSPSKALKPAKHDHRETDEDTSQTKPSDDQTVWFPRNEPCETATSKIVKDLENAQTPCQCHLLRLTCHSKQNGKALIDVLPCDHVETANTVNNTQAKQHTTKGTTVNREILLLADNQSLIDTLNSPLRC